MTALAVPPIEQSTDPVCLWQKAVVSDWEADEIRKIKKRLVYNYFCQDARYESNYSALGAGHLSRRLQSCPQS